MLTSKQRVIMLFVQDYYDREGVTPSYREISDFFDTPLSNTHRILHCLQAREYIRIIPRRARAMEILKRVEL